MLGAVIFDFDGVITDSEILHFRAFNQTLAFYGFEISLKDYYKNYLGLSDFDLFTQLIENKLIKADFAEVENLVSRKNKVFEKLAKTDGKIIDGVRDFLELLRQNNVPIAICSGAVLCEIELILNDAKLRSYFEIIVSAEQVKKGKPYPDGFLLTLRKLNQKHTIPLQPGQCVVIEDSQWGLKAAKAAGMHTIAITNSYVAAELTLAEKVVSHLNELKISDLQSLCKSSF